MWNKIKMNKKNLIEYSGKINRQNREKLNHHKSFVIWFTGLSGSGKSTLAHLLENRFNEHKYHSFVLDGDNVRHGLCSNLGFERDDRSENIRRVAEVAKLMMESGLIVIVALISPFEKDRFLARNIMPHGDFIEVYCTAGLDVCQKRDVKGLYSKANQGMISNFTGVSSPYEEPINPEINVNTASLTEDESLEILLMYLYKIGKIEEKLIKMKS